MTEIRITTLENRLEQLIHRAEADEAIHVTRRGKPVPVLLSDAEYQRRQGHPPQHGSWDAIEATRADPAFEPVDFTQEEVDSWRDRAGGREVARRD